MFSLQLWHITGWQRPLQMSGNNVIYCILENMACLLIYGLYRPVIILLCLGFQNKQDELLYNKVQMKPLKDCILQIWLLHHRGLQSPQKGAIYSQRRHQQAV